MFPGHRDIVMRQEQYKDLLQEAESERLSRAAQPRQSNLRPALQAATTWLGSQMIRWGTKLQDHEQRFST